MAFAASGCLTPAGAERSEPADEGRKVESIEDIIDLPDATAAQEKPEEGKIYHTVLPGETLWRIAKAYEVDQELIMRENGLEDANVQVAQKLYIPGATERVSVEKYRPPKTGTKFVPGEQFGNPCVGIVSAKFGQWRGGQKMDGVEYTVSLGVKVVASRTGEVILVSRSFPGYGAVVVLKHGPQYRTFYGYLSETALQAGDAVAKGEVIGVAGREPATGKTKVHFKLFDGAKPIDPMGLVR